MSVDPARGVSDAFERALADHPAHLKAQQVGLAVSGGGDSIAMLHLAARRLSSGQLRAITIDHGLRPEAAEEIAEVARQAAELGVPHEVAHWQWDGKGNLQAAARAGRREAIYAWALTHNLRHIWLGHTSDDQVETLLMRLARGSGIDGLTGMYPATTRDGLAILRPLLQISRADLRAWLKAERITWCDDPSNDDPRFDRVRARQMMDQLSKLGMTRKRLLQTAAHMQAAQISLQRAAQSFANDHVQQDTGDLLFAPEAMDLSKEDAPRRVLAAALRWIAGQDYRPRFEQLLKFAAEARSGMKATLGGCLVLPNTDGRLRLTREAAATVPVHSVGHVPRQGATWDRRWYLAGPIRPDMHFAALGDAVKACPDWRATGLPRPSLMASPAVWSGDTLVAAPVAGLSNGWSAQIVADFHTSAFAIED